MKEYIERQAVEKMLENAQIITYGEWCGYCTDDVNLDSIPAADVAPMRHGRWILTHRQAASAIFKCSECGREETFDSFHRLENTPYCHCGALMDWTEEEQE